jgi:hypothetical protein
METTGEVPGGDIITSQASREETVEFFAGGFIDEYRGQHARK